MKVFVLSAESHILSGDQSLSTTKSQSSYQKDVPRMPGIKLNNKIFTKPTAFMFS